MPQHAGRATCTGGSDGGNRNRMCIVAARVWGVIVRVSGCEVGNGGWRMHRVGRAPYANTTDTVTGTGATTPVGRVRSANG